MPTTPDLSAPLLPLSARDPAPRGSCVNLSPAATGAPAKDAEFSGINVSVRHESASTQQSVPRYPPRRRHGGPATAFRRRRGFTSGLVVLVEAF